MDDKPAARTTDEFQRVGQNVCERFRLRTRQGNVNQCRDHSHQRPMQNEMGFDPPAHPEPSQEAHDEGPGGSSVMQESVAETQAQTNNRANQSYYREQPTEQNSYPVDSCAIHFPTPVPHAERSAIVAISDESKPVV